MNLENFISTKTRFVVANVIVLFSVTLFVFATVTGGTDLIYMACICTILSMTILYSTDAKKYLIPALFFASIFLFLLGRYGIEIIYELPTGSNNWGQLSQSQIEPHIRQALVLVYTSMASVYLGIAIQPLLATGARATYKKLTLLSGAIRHVRNTLHSTIKPYKSSSLLPIFKSTLSFAALASGIIAITTSIESYLLLKDFSYRELYVVSLLDLSDLPRIFHTLTAVAPFILIASLATLPRTRIAIIELLMLLTIYAPEILLGRRQEFLSAVLLCLVYIVFRYGSMVYRKVTSASRGIKLGSVVALVFTPFLLLVGIQQVDYMRGGTTKVNGPTAAITAAANTLYNQGFSLNVIGYAVAYEDTKPVPHFSSYTLAEVEKSFFCSGVIRSIYNKCVEGSNTNTIAKIGYTSSHYLSYKALGSEKYNAGNGVDSSYIIDAYYDAGYYGVILISILLGATLASMHFLFRLSGITRYIALVFLMSIFFIPRTSATAFIAPLFYLTPYILLICILALSIAIYLMQRRLQNGTR